MPWTCVSDMERLLNAGEYCGPLYFLVQEICAQYCTDSSVPKFRQNKTVRIFSPISGFFDDIDWHLVETQIQGTLNQIEIMCVHF